MGLLACTPYESGDIGQTGHSTSTGTATDTGITTASGTESADATGDDASTTGENTSSTDTDSASTTSSGFVGSDMAESCGTICDIWGVDDCPEGEKCTAVACEDASEVWDTNVCRPIQGAAAIGDECMATDGSPVSGNDTCEAGSICWDIDADTQLGSCVAFCTGDLMSPMCAANHLCSITNNGVTPLCEAQCDPLMQDCPAADDMCLPATEASESGYLCFENLSDDMAPYGAPCSAFNTCNPGLLCLEAGAVPEPGCDSTSCCSPMCSIADAVPCPGAGQTCQPIFMPQPSGFEDVGVCTALP